MGINQPWEDNLAGAINAVLEGDILLENPGGNLFGCTYLLDDAITVDCEGVSFEGREFRCRMHGNEA